MPFEIVRNDIVNMQVDAIVNTANPRPRIGYGVDPVSTRKRDRSYLKFAKLSVILTSVVWRLHLDSIWMPGM